MDLDNLNKKYHFFWTYFYRVTEPFNPYILGGISAVCSKTLLSTMHILMSLRMQSIINKLGVFQYLKKYFPIIVKLRIKRPNV